MDVPWNNRDSIWHCVCCRTCVRPARGAPTEECPGTATATAPAAPVGMVARPAGATGPTGVVAAAAVEAEVADLLRAESKAGWTT